MATSPYNTTTTEDWHENEKIETHAFLPSEDGSDSDSKKQKWMIAKGSRHIVMYSIAVVLWTLSILLAASISARSCSSRFSYETGFDTDLEPIRSAIELQKVRFTGGLKFDENGTVYRVIEPGTVQYVGPPSKEIDRAWKDLIHGEGVDLLGDEAKSVIGKTYQKPSGHWLTGADAFHQLHCINMVRQGLRRDYYTHHDPEPIYTMHLDHCLDYLRQSIMCSADLTAVPILWSKVNGRIVPEFETVHTCRNFDKIHQWSLARDALRHPIT